MDLSVFILSLLSINCYYYTPTLAENPKFTTCKKTTQCWRLTNITYPFYDGKTRPGYCGYPGFLLDCGSSTPQITISNQEYNLLDIDKTANTIKISVRNFNFTTTCPISPPLNTTIDFSSFFFTSADENITFFYDCAVPRPSLLQIQCDLLGSSLTGYYLTPTTLNAYNGRDFFESCKSVLIPVLQTQAELINKGPPTVATVVNAFRVGFDLGLTAAITEPCSSCVGSGGACGSDSGNFVCYCTDGDFHSRCGVDPVTREGNHNITALAVGASIGGLFLVVFVIGGWFLVLHQRKKHLLIAQEKTSQGPINGLQIANQVSNGPPSSQTYNTSNSTSTTYTHSSSSYTSSRPADERSCSYFGVPVFNYSELQQATDNFHESKELGSGGYGSVYYGRLLDGREVAVKRLYENTFKRMEQFMNEIEILAHLRHPNLVTLYGCTSTKSRVLVLVYEYVANGTVADHLHGKHAKNGLLEWPIRLSIAIETAEALAYLHRSDVIHRDVKTTNILLDNEFHVKVADFGLSRLFPNDATHVSTFPQGTPGYVDPEYYNCYRVTEKSDVYSFGVILMELISSMQAVDGDRGNHLNLASMALDRIQNRALHELVDPRIGFDRDSEIERMVKRVAELGFQCLQQDKDLRPTMEEVATTLRGIQMVEADLQKHEGMVCGDDVGLLKNTRTL